MKNKGFTLIEVIAVIIVLGLVALIAVPNVNKAIKKSKENLYNKQINTIEKASKQYALNNSDLLNQGRFRVTVSDLKNANLIEKADAVNPITEEDMNGYVRVSYNGNKYKYNYFESEEEEIKKFHPFNSEYLETNDFFSDDVVGLLTMSESFENFLNSPISFSENSYFAFDIDGNFIDAGEFIIYSSNDYDSLAYYFEDGYMITFADNVVYNRVLIPDDYKKYIQIVKDPAKKTITCIISELLEFYEDEEATFDEVKNILLAAIGATTEEDLVEGYIYAVTNTNISEDEDYCEITKELSYDEFKDLLLNGGTNPCYDNEISSLKDFLKIYTLKK